MIALFTLVFSLIPPSESYTFVWGPEDEYPSFVLDRLSLGSFPELSFIKLDFIEATLIINMVQRGTGWPKGQSFCSLVLPASIREFLSVRGINTGTEWKQISVINFAEPRIAGCKCYSRVMSTFGFDLVNGIPAEQFCSLPEPNDIMSATRSGAVKTEMGVSSETQLEILRTAIRRP
jgi:hypothetical protein